MSGAAAAGESQSLLSSGTAVAAAAGVATDAVAKVKKALSEGPLTFRVLGTYVSRITHSQKSTS